MKKVLFVVIVFMSFNICSSQIIRRNVGAIGNAIKKMDSNHEEALNIRNAIIDYISSVPLNSAENEWKKEYIERVVKRIDGASRFGNYSSALSTAIEALQNVKTDPALMGRFYANQDYEECREFAKGLGLNSDYLSLINQFKLNIDSLCQKYAVSIYSVEYKGNSYAELGDELYKYAITISLRPRSYKDWLYLIYLSAKCGNKDAIEQCNDYGLTLDTKMFKGHSSGLF